MKYNIVKILQEEICILLKITEIELHLRSQLVHIKFYSIKVNINFLEKKEKIKRNTILHA